MKKVKYWLLTGLIVILMLPGAPVSAALLTPTNIGGEAALLVDLDTGQILSDKDSKTRYPIASTTKLLTVYLVEQAIKDKQLNNESEVIISKDLSEFSENQAYSGVPLAENQKITVHDLIEQTLIASSNAASIALAEKVSGKVPDFVAKMNEQLATWGIEDAKLVSPSGLPNEDMGVYKIESMPGDAENKLSARELATVAKHVIEDFPALLTYTRKQAVETPSRDGMVEIKNTNALLSNGRGYTFEGLKTGSAVTNGYSFVGLTTLDQQHVISVVLGNNFDTSNAVFDDTITMLNQAKKELKTVTLPADKMVRKVTVKDAKPNKPYPLRTATATRFFAPKNFDAKNVGIMTRGLTAISAPLKKGQEVDRHELVFLESDNEDEYNRLNDMLGNPPYVTLISGEEVHKADWWTLQLNHIKTFFQTFFE
ncbi:MAG: D-alanyl-D-alanine carboxypeptidase [Lactobacillaceae bacterium]|jgi:D-alanyl-D-alanine carboxypeptidase (penicillin-binding protein 5/6)|nr:D-alanyl-D-alanine carboxypeptidase [Lactobacillaceae bacterium]